MKSFGILKNVIQPYAWGSYTAIPRLLGEASASETPCAELWMGAHPKACSLVYVEDRWVSLQDLIDQNPVDVLGRHVAGKYDHRLPFLLKVLAAEQPLSVQVHPGLKQAKKGFERENSRNIPLSAPERNYRDDNHKPECICALTPFWAMNGFRSISEILKRMKCVCPEEMQRELGILREERDPGRLKRFFTALMTMEIDRRLRIIDKSMQKAEELSEYDPAFQWMRVLHHHYPGDIGVFSPVLLNLVRLEPGEAMFLDSAQLHGYLKGMGIELMANSDNVLRGGLTRKHIEVEELLNVVDFTQRSVAILRPKKRSKTEQVYAAPVDEFVLSIISVGETLPHVSGRNRSIEILLCTDGEAVLTDTAHRTNLRVRKGISVVVPAAMDVYGIEGKAVFYKASVPV